MINEYIIKNKNDTKILAENIAKNVSRRTIITLNGDLGSGKTFFSSCFINYFMKKKEIIVSPTFNIVKMYSADDFYIYHFDLYRLKNVEELYELDIEDAFDNVSLIEWPDIAINKIKSSNCKIISINIKVFDKYRIFYVDN